MPTKFSKISLEGTFGDKLQVYFFANKIFPQLKCNSHRSMWFRIILIEYSFRKKNRLAVTYTFLLPMNLARKNIEFYGFWGKFVDKIAGTMCEVLLAATVISARKLACSALFGDVRQITYSCNLMSYVSCNYVSSYLRKFQLLCAESNL